MPKIKINGAWIYYEMTGDGPETTVFAHGFLMSGPDVRRSGRLRLSAPIMSLIPPESFKAAAEGKSATGGRERLG